MKRLGALSRAMIDAALPLSTEESEAVAKEIYRRYITDILGYNAAAVMVRKDRATAKKRKEVKP